MEQLLYPFVIALFFTVLVQCEKKYNLHQYFKNHCWIGNFFYRLGTDWLETILQFCIQLMHHPT